jgi:hypothetical protein
MDFRIEPGTGKFQRWDGGIFGQGWIDTPSNDGWYRRIDPLSGRIQRWDGGIFGQGWI